MRDRNETWHEGACRGDTRPPQTSSWEDHYIVRNASVQPSASSATIHAQRHNTPTAGVMVWEAIINNTRSPLVLIRGTMVAQRYVHGILQPHALSLMQRFSGAVLQQHNAWPHTARVSQDCLRTVTTLPWCARSLDLSPIEHIWDHLGRQVGHPTSLNDLHQIWNEMSQEIIQNLYSSMPYRIASYIRSREDSKRY
ncbi:transposable element Tcb1 transposase [Trichonephila clavipes]|nr:transposable element Tcb1 transposase [Trichonephila clavipes]